MFTRWALGFDGWIDQAKKGSLTIEGCWWALDSHEATLAPGNATDRSAALLLGTVRGSPPMCVVKDLTSWIVLPSLALPPLPLLPPSLMTSLVTS